jgi:hypothetical protein
MISIVGISLSFISILIQKYGITILPISICTGLIAIIGLLTESKYLQVLQSYLIFYLFIIVLWPRPPQRFIIPILPIRSSVLFESDL